MSDEIETRLLKRGAAPRPSFIGADPDELLDDQLYRARLLGLGRLVLSVESLAEILCETEDDSSALSASDNETVNWWLKAARKRPLRLDLPPKHLSLEQRRSYLERTCGSGTFLGLSSSSAGGHNPESVKNAVPDPLASDASPRVTGQQQLDLATATDEADQPAHAVAAPDAPPAPEPGPGSTEFQTVTGQQRSSRQRPSSAGGSGKLGLKAALLFEDEDGDEEAFTPLFGEAAPVDAREPEEPPSAEPTNKTRSRRPTAATGGAQAIRNAFRGILGEAPELSPLSSDERREQAIPSAGSDGQRTTVRAPLDTAKAAPVQAASQQQDGACQQQAEEAAASAPSLAESLVDAVPAALDEGTPAEPQPLEAAVEEAVTQTLDEVAPPPALPAEGPLEDAVVSASEAELAAEVAEWIHGLQDASGTVSWDSLSQLFHSNYLPLRKIVAQLPEELKARARKALATWSSSFEGCYLQAFEQLRAGAPRPPMVLDAPNVAFRLSRRIGARNLKLVLVDSLRTDVGLMAWEKLRLQSAGQAEWVDGGTLWSALPATTATQLELIARGAEGLRGELTSGLGEQQLVSSAEGRRLRPMRVGPHPLLKLDAVQLRVRDEESWTQAGLESLAADVATSIGREMRKQAPGTLLLIFGDHGFADDRSETNGAGPEQVLVPYSAWLTGEDAGESGQAAAG